MKTPRELGLPFDSWRKGQRLAIRSTLAAKTPIVVLQSPVGSGKSLMAAAILKLDDRRGVVLTATKGLERQYLDDFSTQFVNVHGMGNYICDAARHEFKTLFYHRKGTIYCDDGPCRSGHACTLKENGCQYFDRYRTALASDTVLTNYSYWFAMRRFGRGLGPCHRLICDEAHALPEELMSANQITIPIRLLEGKAPRTHKKWREWATGAADALKPSGDLPFDQRQRKQKLIDSLLQLASIDQTWAWDVHDSSIVFEPTVPRLLLKTLADPATTPSVVLLSATITPSTVRLLGIPDRDVTFIQMTSRFPPARRPVYVVDTVRVDHKMTGDHIAFWISRMDRIIGKRLDRKGIIHTISYERARFIQSHSKHGGMMLAPRSAFELTAAVERFRKAPAGTILLSPSVMTGWDFPYTDCEYQIIVKVPFPDTRSAIVRARIKATTGYREHLTMQALVQATGRGMRAEDDRCETFIIDSHAMWFLPLANRLGLSPQWFTDALHYTKRVPDPPPTLASERET